MWAEQISLHCRKSNKKKKNKKKKGGRKLYKVQRSMHNNTIARCPLRRERKKKKTTTNVVLTCCRCCFFSVLFFYWHRAIRIREFASWRKKKVIKQRQQPQIKKKTTNKTGRKSKKTKTHIIYIYICKWAVGDDGETAKKEKQKALQWTQQGNEKKVKFSISRDRNRVNSQNQYQ